MSLTLAAMVLSVATQAVAARASIETETVAVEPAEPAMPEPEGPSVPELVSPAAEAVALSWEAPAGCPDAAAVRRALAGYLGEGPSVEAGAAVRAVARVTRTGGTYRLALSTETASGTSVRETTATDCAVLVDATAVIVAIAVDPSTMLARGDAAPKPVEPEPEPGTAEPGTAEPEPTAPAEPATADPAESAPDEIAPAEVAPAEPALAPDVAPEPASPESRIRFGLRVAGGVDLGVLPGPAGGLRVAGSVLGGGWRAELRGDFWFPRTTDVRDGIGARASLWSLGARGCWVPAVERVPLEFPLCAGLESGAMRGEPVGDRIANPTPTSRFWLATDAGAGLAWVPRRFLAVVLQAELVVPLVRAGFQVGGEEVHRAGPVAGRALLGLEARFP